MCGCFVRKCVMHVCVYVMYDSHVYMLCVSCNECMYVTYVMYRVRVCMHVCYVAHGLHVYFICCV